MQNITVKDPETNKDIDVEISAEEYNHQQAWRVKFNDGNSALLGLDQHRIWKQFDGNEIGSQLISEIGKAIDVQEH